MILDCYYIRLLKLDPIIQAGVRDKMITMGHAKAIINITSQETQLNLYHSIIKNKLSVRETELIVKENRTHQVIQNTYNSTLSMRFQEIEDKLSDFLDKKINLKLLKGGRGKIEILFESEKQLDEIIKLLQS